MKGSAMVYGHQTWEILAQMKEEKNLYYINITDIKVYY